MLSAEEIENYFDRLWPLCRSITGEGVRQTFSILKEIIPLNLREITSGTPIFDWEVPKEWVIRSAYLEHESGKRVLDFKDHNLHVIGYSLPMDRVMDLQELLPHLYTLPDLPDAIPYLTSYYEPRWGFCLSQRARDQLAPGKYKVVIDSALIKGSMTLGDCVLPGTSDEEILISTYICHPSLANNELSGPLLSAFLYKELAQIENRKYSIRFTFAPETIGTIAYLSLFGEEMVKRVRGGLVVSCVGNAHPFFYFVRSKGGTTELDRAIEHVIQHSSVGLRSVDFNPILCSDLRQLASPGFNLPVASLTRTLFSYGEYFGASDDEIFQGYHSSLDNKEIMDFEAMIETIEILKSSLGVLDQNDKYERVNPYCEPQLSKRNLYPSLSEREFNKDWKWVEQMCTLLNFCDGRMDLLSIAEKSGYPFHQLLVIAETLSKHDLLRIKKD